MGSADAALPDAAGRRCPAGRTAARACRTEYSDGDRVPLTAQRAGCCGADVLRRYGDGRAGAEKQQAGPASGSPCWV